MASSADVKILLAEEVFFLRRSLGSDSRPRVWETEEDAKADAALEPDEGWTSVVRRVETITEAETAL